MVVRVDGGGGFRSSTATRSAAGSPYGSRAARTGFGPRHHNTAIDWRRSAACAGTDPELWYDPERFEAAKAICAECPVIAECRRRVDALECGTKPYTWFGVWAGEAPIERRRRRQAEATAAPR